MDIISQYIYKSPEDENDAFIKTIESAKRQSGKTVLKRRGGKTANMTPILEHGV